MADQRTRRQKLQAMADDPGASEGERANARSILKRMGPEPELVWRRAVQKSAWQRIIDEMHPRQYDDWQYRTPQWETRRQAEETLRRADFTTAQAQQAFRRASEDVSRAQRRDPLDESDTERLMRDYLEGRATISDLRRHMGMEDT